MIDFAICFILFSCVILSAVGRFGNGIRKYFSSRLRILFELKVFKKRFQNFQNFQNFFSHFVSQRRKKSSLIAVDSFSIQSWRK